MKVHVFAGCAVRCCSQPSWHTDGMDLRLDEMPDCALKIDDFHLQCLCFSELRDWYFNLQKWVMLVGTEFLSSDGRCDAKDLPYGFHECRGSIPAQITHLGAAV